MFNILDERVMFPIISTPILTFPFNQRDRTLVALLEEERFKVV